jgi:hypothetical protein
MTGRWVQIRRDLFQQVKTQVRHLLGEESKGLARYRWEFEKEFQKPWLVSSKGELLQAMEKAQIVYLGDFHALQQSQRAQLRILKSLSSPQQIVLGVEFLEARQQKNIDRYLQGNLPENEFLKLIEWKKRWGFPWEHYRPLMRWAKKNKVRVYGLNEFSQDRSIGVLRKRDVFAAEQIGRIRRLHSRQTLFVIFGDLHLASRHLPLQVRKKDKTSRQVFVYQNAETIYFQLLEKGIELEVDVVSLAANKFCLLSVPPWVKWQNYLIYLEENFDKEIDDELDLTDSVAQYVKVIAADLGVQVSVDHFSVSGPHETKFWQELQRNLPPKSLQTYQILIENGRSFYWPQKGIAYLARNSVNSAAELAMAIVFAALSQQEKRATRLPSEFPAMIWQEAVQYFGSKLINPKRKTDTLSDIRAALSSRHPADQGRETLQLAINQKMAELLYLSGTYGFAKPVPRDLRSSIEAARLLGGILGEKIFHAYRKGQLSKSKVLGLLQKKTDDKNFAQFYWEILEVIEGLPEPFGSKTEKL